MKDFNVLKKELYDIKNEIKKWSVYYDEKNLYPIESIKKLKELKLFNRLFLKNGDISFSIRELEEVIQIISSSCLSTGLICGMHFQQIITIIKHSNLSKNHIIKEILNPQLIIASVTSEYNKGGDINTFLNSLKWKDELNFTLNRKAPTVTGGMYSDAYLLANKASQKENRNTFIFFLKEEATIKKLSSWNALGVRSTQSDAISITATLNKENNLIFDESYDDILNQTFIPLGHILWSSAWLGCTKEAFRECVKLIRENSNKKTDINLIRLSEVRRKIDLVTMYLKQMNYEYLDNNDVSRRKIIHINDLKIISSSFLFESVNILIDISGLAMGYQKNENCFLEKYFRDLKSASLMYNNDRLNEINGKLNLFDSNLLP